MRRDQSELELAAYERFGIPEGPWWSDDLALAMAMMKKHLGLASYEPTDDDKQLLTGHF